MTGLHKLTIWYLLLIPIVGGLSTLEIETGSGFTLTGLVWVGQAAVGFLILLFGYVTGTFRGSAGTWGPWIVLCGWIWLSLMWCNDLSRRNIQEALQLCTPLLVGLIAAAAIRTREDLKRLLQVFGITFVLVAIYACFAIGVMDEEWVRKRTRPAALTTALVGCVFMASFPRRFWLPLIGWGACLLLTTLTESRMATLVLLAVPVLHPSYRNKLWNLATAVGFAGLGALLFYAPVFQQRFFKGGGGTLSDVASGNFSGAGRFEAWPYILQEAWQQPVLGSGVGSAFEFVPTVWDKVNHVHNDYLRFFFELGAVGLAIFIVAAVWQLAVLYRRIGRSEGVVRTALVACWLGFCVLFISCATDNTILYNIYYMNLLFAVLGGAYGVAWAESHSQQVADAPDAWSVAGVRELRGYGGIRLGGTN